VHDILPVAIPSPDHHHRFLMAFLTLRGARHHPPFDEIDPQRPLGAGAHVDGRPGILRQRGVPRLDALPGTRGASAPSAGLQRRRLQVAQHRVARPGQQLTLAQASEPTPQPIRTPQLVIPGPPRLRQPRTAVLHHLQGPLRPRTGPATVVRHTGLVQAGLLLGPRYGQGQAPVHQGRLCARDLAQLNGHLTVIDLAQAATPLARHAYRLGTGLAKRGRIDPHHALGWSQWCRDVACHLLAQGGIIPRRPANEALQRQPIVAEAVRDRCDVFACHIRQQATPRGLGMRRGFLTAEGGDKGAIKVSNRGSTWSKMWGETWHSSSNCCLRVAYSASMHLLLPGTSDRYQIHWGYSYITTYAKSRHVRQSN
jgi:hypothetical protein